MIPILVSNWVFKETGMEREAMHATNDSASNQLVLFYFLKFILFGPMVD